MNDQKIWKIWINPFLGMGIAFGTALAVLSIGFVGAALSSSYERSCTPDNTGKVSCTENFKYGGWSSVPVKEIAGLAGTSFAAWRAYEAAKKSSEDREEKPVNDVPN